MGGNKSLVEVRLVHLYEFLERNRLSEDVIKAALTIVGVPQRVAAALETIKLRDKLKSKS
jgi:hypothetical protein